MNLSGHGNKAQVTRSLSVAAFVLERTADSWGAIQKIIGLPEALYVVGKTLPILAILLKSLGSSIKNNEETKDSKESFAAAYRFAELSQQQAKYFDAIFNAISTTDNHNTKEQKYRIAAKKCGGKPIEAIFKDLLQQAAGLATDLVADGTLISSLQAAYDEVAKLKPSLAENLQGPVSINNYGDGTQFYHSGEGSQNHCSGGSQYTASVYTWNTGISKDSGYASVVQKIDLMHNVAERKLTNINDKMISYPSALKISPAMKEDYISGLAKDIFEKTKSGDTDRTLAERVSRILPGLLKSFVLRLRFQEPQVPRNILAFIHKNRREITKFFEMTYRTEEDKKMTLDEIMGRWNTDLENAADNPSKRHAATNFTDTSMHLEDWMDEKLTNEESDENNIEDINDDTGIYCDIDYKKFILSSQAYDWLLVNIRREYFLTSADSNTMEAIRDQIVKTISPLHKEGPKRHSETYKVTFVLDWNPRYFADKQEYKEEPSEAIGMAITITGSLTDAQALNCSQYLSQTWPSTGEHIIRLIKDVVRGEPGTPHSYNLPDKTQLTAWIKKDQFVIDVFGTKYHIAEVGEQLAWLTSALSHPHQDDGVSFSTPFINQTDLVNLAELSIRAASCSEICLRISTDVQTKKTHFVSSNGRCWYNLFNNPVVVTGYPIPRRPKLDTGLEIPLHMMAGLAKAKKVNLFDGKLFIKGFSTMLVPTNRTENVITWHLTYKEDGSRISYLEKNALHAEDVSLFDLESSRHILGWCSEAFFFAGASNANFGVKPSLLRSPPNNGTPQNLLYMGQQTVGPGYSAGVKDIPVRLSYGGYIDKLNWIHERFVVLWDEEDKRGWLVNGTSALLHLVRSSLDNDSRGECNSKFLFNPELLKEAEETHKPNSAIKVLQEDDNRRLKIYKERDRFIRFEDRIEEFFDMMERLIDYEVKATIQSELTIKRKHLYGWDFNDLARCQYPIYPRVAQIQPAGKGWIDFIKSIQAVTLFGRKFGEIIRPGKEFACTRWAKLPKGEYYLATSSYDIKSIMRMDRKSSKLKTSPVQLNNGIHWYITDKVFDVCKCHEVDRNGHSDCVQTLLPSRFRKKGKPESIALVLGDNSAVIFGHNSSSKWRWNDGGAPAEGYHPLLEESDSEFEDSGANLGTRSNTSQSSRDATISTSQTTPTITSIKSLRDRYTVGIICALPKELMAVRILLDNKAGCDANDVWREIPDKDDNCYVFGRMSDHDVVALCLPSGAYGTNSAASAVSNMKRTFDNIAFCLLVGIGGGVPSSQNDIRLGDVVVSTPTREYPGVVQHDFEKVTGRGEYERIGSLQRPPDFLLSAMSILQSDPDLPLSRLLKDIATIGERQQAYRYPGSSHDKLFAAEYTHTSSYDTCSKCQGPTVKRKERQVSDESSGRYQVPRIHYGNIASGNQVIKNAQKRDEISRKCKVLCIEMEAAGIMNIIPCLVIRGICDYSDSHKNDEWQEYAAATAAAYAKFLLSVVRGRKVR